MGSNKSSVKRSEYILEQLVEERGLTEQGKNWLIAAFDPFHDSRLELIGYPDSNGQSSVLQIVTQTFTVSAPGNYFDNYDCHIVDFPFMGPIGAGGKPTNISWSAPGDSSGAIVNGRFNNPQSLSNGNVFCGGVQAYVFGSSANNVDIFTGTVLSQVGVTMPLEYMQNPWRMVAKGFEVYNTTAELYKNGSVIVYKQPIQNYLSASGCVYYNSTSVTSSNTTVSTLIMEAPPSTASEALLLTSSRQWDAKEGCYVIPTIHSHEMPTNLGNFTQWLSYLNTPGDTTFYGPQMPQFPVTSNSSVLAYCPLNQNWTEYDQFGAIFSGLTNQSTLTVNVRYIIESFPTSGSLLQTLATPSPVYDPNALLLYAKLTHASPIGVEVRFNGWGDWFNDAISTVAEIAMPAMQSLVPGGKILSKLAGGGKKKKKR